MAKFNQTNTIKTTNRSGNVAYRMNDKEHLVTSVLTTMFGEHKFYGSTDSDIRILAEKMAKEDPFFLAKLTIYARKEANLRSVSHVLTAIIAREAKDYTRLVLCNVIVRADDILEIMSVYEQMYGKPWPNAMKREIAVQLGKFDEYQIAKYNGGNKALKFRDVLRITHPVPKNEASAALYKKVLNDELEIPVTWETQLSANGNTAEVWNELIASRKLGYMAELRNLRNIIKSGADYKTVLNDLTNHDKILKSKQFPFRYFSAFRELEKAGVMTQDIRVALNQALTESTQNIPRLEGRTLIAIDVSTSMDSYISAKSEVKCKDIASLMGAIAAHICEDATVCYFSSNGWYYWHKNAEDKRSGYKIEKYGNYDSILDIANASHEVGCGGTDLSLPFDYMLNYDKGLKYFDRIIYFSDNETNCNSHTIQSYADQYRNRFNRDLWVHAVDLQGYGTQQFCGNRFNLIAGWNEKILEFIPMIEAGFGGLVSHIENMEVE